MITTTIGIETKTGKVIPVATFCGNSSSISLLRRGNEGSFAEYSELDFINAESLEEALAIVSKIYGNSKGPAKAIIIEEKETSMKRELNTYSEFPCVTREYVIRGYHTRIQCPVVAYDTDKFNRLLKFIEVYRDDENIRVGHYIVVVSKELDKNFLSTIYVVADPHGYCLAPWMDTAHYVNKGRPIDPNLIPDLIKAELVQQFGHLVD